MSNGLTAARYFLSGLDPCQILLRNGYQPDPWQAELLRLRPNRAICCWGRQTGKSRAMSALVQTEALFRGPSTILISSYNQKKSKEMLIKVMDLYKPFADEVPLVVDSTEEKWYANGSRVIALTGDDDAARSYTAQLVVIDEAAFTTDALRAAINFCLSTTNGPLVAMSTPPRRPMGWWYGTWTRDETLPADTAAGPERDGWRAGFGPDGWYRSALKSSSCPRISKAFLEQSRLDLGDQEFLRECECDFPTRGKFGGNRPFDPGKVAAIPRVSVSAFGG